jgi:hypothetical protein
VRGETGARGGDDGIEGFALRLDHKEGDDGQDKMCNLACRKAMVRRLDHSLRQTQTRSGMSRLRLSMAMKASGNLTICRDGIRWLPTQSVWAIAHCSMSRSSACKLRSR